MTTDELWSAIDRQRVAVCDLLETLTEPDWDRPSLCDGWTVRNVAAHLTLQQFGLSDVPKAVIAIARERGSLDGGIRRLAVDASAKPTSVMIAEIRAMVGSRRKNLGVTEKETLIDALVHAQDIAIPLGRDLPMEPGAAAIAADRVWELKAPFHAKTRFSGVRLVGADTEWSVGQGVEVRGPMRAVLLTLTGRYALLSDLSGPGAAGLAERLLSE